ncbi:MAG: DNA-processing protein DprA [Rikenellaceae bacterium]
MANIYDIALTLTPHLGANGVAHLLDIFSTADNIFSASLDELTHFAQLKPEIAKSIIEKRSTEQAKAEMIFCQRNNITPIASTDDEYPKLLREMNDYPHVLYAKGNIKILNNLAVSIVGTRKISPYGQRACDSIVKELAKCVPNGVVVSGLAFGVDSEVHRAALRHHIPTIAVLPSPLNAITPAQHTRLANEIVESGGALITELHSQIKHMGRFYISRNRIIAGYSGATILVESPESGGAMVTAKMASGYNRVVGAVPGRITDAMSAGCNKLLANRVATPILSAADIIRELMWDLQDDVKASANTSPITLTEKEVWLLRHFKDDEPIHMDKIMEMTSLSIGEFSALMMGLEFASMVRLLPGNKYERLIPLNNVNSKI